MAALQGYNHRIHGLGIPRSVGFYRTIPRDCVISQSTFYNTHNTHFTITRVMVRKNHMICGIPDPCIGSTECHLRCSLCAVCH